MNSEIQSFCKLLPADFKCWEFKGGGRIESPEVSKFHYFHYYDEP